MTSLKSHSLTLMVNEGPQATNLAQENLNQVKPKLEIASQTVNQLRIKLAKLSNKKI